jgi:acyl-CoA thioesterase
MSQLRAEVRNVGAERGHLTTAAFGASRRGFEATELAPPVVPPPADCPSFRDPPPPGVAAMEPMPFWEEMVEGRQALGRRAWSTAPPGPATRATWYRFEEPPSGPDGHLDPAALPILVDIMPGAMWERLELDTPPWFGPSVDLTLHVLDAAPTGWMLGVNSIRHASDGYASADMELWDVADEPRLVAYATQVFLFTFL